MRGLTGFVLYSGRPQTTQIPGWRTLPIFLSCWMRSVLLGLVCVLRNTRYERTRSILHYRAPALPLDLYQPRSMAISRCNRCNFGAHWHSGCWHGSIHWVEASSRTRGHTPPPDFLSGIYASDERFQSVGRHVFESIPTFLLLLSPSPYCWRNNPPSFHHGD